MKSRLFRFVMSLLALVLLPLLAGAQTSEIFEKYAPGVDGTPVWTPARGFWWMEHGQYCEESGTYDNGSFLSSNQSGSFELSARVIIRHDYAGAGFHFNSFSRSEIGWSHMVRLDGNRLIYGFLDAGAYQAQGEVELSMTVERDTWYTLSLTVDAVKGVYGFGLDGVSLINDIPLIYHSGFAGLENSGSYACFDDVVLTDISEDKDRLAGRIAWPTSISAQSDRSVWVGSPADGKIIRYDAGGEPIETLEDRFDGLFRVASFGNRLAVLDSTTWRINSYERGAWKTVIRTPIRKPVSMGFWSADTLWLAGGKEVGLYDFATGSYTQLARLDHEIALADVSREFLLTLDRTQDRFRVATLDGENRHSIPAPFTVVRDAKLVEGAVLAAYLDRVTRFAFSGEVENVFDVPMMGGLVPSAISMAGGDVWIADFVKGRIMRTDEQLTLPEMDVDFSDGSANISWTTNATQARTLSVLDPDGSIRSFSVRTVNGRQMATFDVQAGELYNVFFDPILHTIPAALGGNTGVPVLAPAPPGEMIYKSLPVAIIILTNVKNDENGPHSQVSSEEVDRIIKQLEEGRLFYWMNSGMQFNLDFDWIIDDSPYLRSDLFGPEYYYPPHDAVIREILERSNRDVSRYPSVVFVPLTREQDAAGKYVLDGGGGGFTTGLGWNGKYGRSWWLPTVEHHPAGNNWLFVHEFHHQLDELFQWAGYPKYWFNHFSPHVGWAANFGEHFDGNAWILKNWPRAYWFDFPFGETRYAVDVDNDRIPDDEPDVPMDERRMGSNPERRDTDDDGLDDLLEIQFSNWVVEGWGQTANPGFNPNTVLSVDSDGDGTSDLNDPYPLFGFETDISEEWLAIGHLPVADTVKVFIRHSDKALELKLEGPRVPVRVLVDGDANGWFVGKENLEVLWSDTGTPETRVFNASDPEQWPFTDAELSKTATVSEVVMEGFRVLRIPNSEEVGLKFEPGSAVGLDISVGYLTDVRGKKRYMSLSEPNRFIVFNLK